MTEINTRSRIWVFKDWGMYNVSLLSQRDFWIRHTAAPRSVFYLQGPITRLHCTQRRKLIIYTQRRHDHEVFYENLRPHAKVRKRTHIHPMLE